MIGEIYQVIANSKARLFAVAMEKACLAEDPYGRGFEEIVNSRGVVVQEWITVHLADVDPAQVLELLEDGWRRFAPKRAIATRDAK